MRHPRQLAASAATRMLSRFVPTNKTLPFKYWVQAVAGEIEPELVNLGRYCGSDGAAIDIGANLGWYTYALSKRFKRVYAFEANDEVTGWIGKYNPGNIELIHCGLSSTAGTARFYVPVAHGLTLTGWGSLDRDNLQNAESLLEKDIRLAPLDDFEISGVGFVKIDVEGHELEVLKGAAATIAHSRPIVLIELKESNLHTVRSWFLDHKYHGTCLKDLVGVPGDPQNHIYVPVERLAEFGIRPVQ